MKIAIIAHSVFPIKQPYSGGLEKFIHILATELSKRGLDVTLYAHKDSQVGRYKLTPFTNFNYKYDNNFDLLNKDYLNLLQELRNNDYDLIHNNSLNNDLLSLSQYSTPVLTTLHVPPIEGFKQAVYKNFCNSNSFTNIVSYSCLKSWKALDNCKVIHNGIDVNSWTLGTQERQGAIWFGRICPEKGVERSIAAANLSNLPITLVGPINNKEYFEYLSINYKDKFTHIGLSNRAELNELIGKSKVFIKAPVWEEPFGLVYLESLACGTPIATYDSHISNELLTSSVSFITKKNIKSLSEGATDASKYIDNNMCRTYAKDNFGLDKMISNYINYYEEILCTK